MYVYPGDYYYESNESNYPWKVEKWYRNRAFLDQDSTIIRFEVSREVIASWKGYTPKL